MPVRKGATIDPAATRARILNTATDLFYERGVHAVGVQEIAAAAKASKESLYRSFPSKQALVAAAIAERSDRIHAWLERETSGTPTGIDPVLRIFDVLNDWYSHADFHGCAVFNAATDTRGDDEQPVAELARKHLDRYRNLLTGRLRQLDPPPTNPELLARQLLLLIEGATTVTAIDGPDATAGQDARQAAIQLITTTPATPTPDP